METEFQFEYLSKLTDQELCELINFCLLEYDKEKGNEAAYVNYVTKINNLGISNNSFLGKVLNIKVQYTDGGSEVYRMSDYGLTTKAGDFSSINALQRYMLLKFGDNYLARLKAKLENDTKTLIEGHVTFLTSTPPDSRTSFEQAKELNSNIYQP